MRTAILVAAHNEEAVIEQTLRTCIGQADVFVASDGSTDRTAIIAKTFTPHVLEIVRHGKGAAVRQLIDHYDICANYDAFVVLDADSLLRPGTIGHFERALKPGVAGAVGRIEALPGSLASYWRAVQHFMMAKLYRRGMALANCIHIMPGTCAIWSTAAFSRIVQRETPTEDIDWTYQIHRRKLGRIAYAPAALVQTAEPLTLRDYARQMLRWFRGYWRTTAYYNTPFGFQSLDAGQAFFITEIALNWARILALPFIAFGLLSPWFLLSFAYDGAVLLVFAVAAAIAGRSWRIAAMLPLVVWFYLFDMALSLCAILTYHQLTAGTWKSPVRLTTKGV